MPEILQALIDMFKAELLPDWFADIQALLIQWISEWVLPALQPMRTFYLIIEFILMLAFAVCLLAVTAFLVGYILAYFGTMMGWA